MADTLLCNYGTDMTIKTYLVGTRSRSDQVHSQSPCQLLFTQDWYGTTSQSAALSEATSGPLDGHHVSTVPKTPSADSDPSCQFQESLLPCPSLPRLEERHTILSFTITPSFGASVSVTFFPHPLVNFSLAIHTLFPLWSLVKSRSLQSLADILCLVHQGRIFYYSKTNKHDRCLTGRQTQSQGHFDCTAPAGDLL